MKKRKKTLVLSAIELIQVGKRLERARGGLRHLALKEEIQSKNAGG